MIIYMNVLKSLLLNNYLNCEYHLHVILNIILNCFVLDKEVPFHSQESELIEVFKIHFHCYVACHLNTWNHLHEILGKISNSYPKHLRGLSKLCPEIHPNFAFNGGAWGAESAIRAVYWRRGEGLFESAGDNQGLRIVLIWSCSFKLTRRIYLIITLRWRFRWLIKKNWLIRRSFTGK